MRLYTPPLVAWRFLTHSPPDQASWALHATNLALTGSRRMQKPLEAFKPGDVVKGVVRRHHIDHGILVDVNGLWDGCACTALTRSRHSATGCDRGCSAGAVVPLISLAL